MSESISLVLIWGLAANLAAILPRQQDDWTPAYILIAIGIPILGYVTMQHGPWAGLIVLVAGMAALRWPVVNFGRWLRSRID
ncbi:DUF2484 family protein [Pseudooceanicola sediminis]|uniref:DUF2484 family protein n=1 Tax=Pseudooceanicola sediminis TaxID=2211117 RepID=A0A399J1I1_9RHOB|nr:DUF2484 family protein [Puniceibacterium sp. HSS470]RII39283.1 DUF2484 family protein [Pseudooceanicola sediminis]